MVWASICSIWRLIQAASVRPASIRLMPDLIAMAITLAYKEACDDLAATTDGTHFNRFVERHIGPMTLTCEGLAVPRKTQPSSGDEGCVNKVIAGGRAIAAYTREIYRSVFRRAA